MIKEIPGWANYLLLFVGFWRYVQGGRRPAEAAARAALLGEDRTSHAARHALQAMPYPEAGAALRSACMSGRVTFPSRRSSPSRLPMSSAWPE